MLLVILGSVAGCAFTWPGLVDPAQVGAHLHSHAALSCAQLYTWTSLPCLLVVHAAAGGWLMVQPRTAVMHSVIIAQHLDPALQPAPLQAKALHMLAAQTLATSLQLLLDPTGCLNDTA